MSALHLLPAYSSPKRRSAGSFCIPSRAILAISCYAPLLALQADSDGLGERHVGVIDIGVKLAIRFEGSKINACVWDGQFEDGRRLRIEEGGELRGASDLDAAAGDLRNVDGDGEDVGMSACGHRLVSVDTDVSLIGSAHTYVADGLKHQE